MPEAEQLDFEGYMRLGEQHHLHMDYQAALSLRFEAFKTADNHIDQGRAARDIAASFDRIGNDWEPQTEQAPLSSTDSPEVADNRPALNNQLRAEAYAEYAIREHELGLPSTDVIGNRSVELDEITLRSARELTVSDMYGAVLAARRNDGIPALRQIRRAKSVSQALFSRYGQYHQYDVNLMGRAAGIESVYSTSKFPLSLLWAAKLAKSLARVSESENILDRNNSLSVKEVKAAQLKASVRARAAAAIVRMAQYPSRRYTRPLAKLILNKVVL